MKRRALGQSKEDTVCDVCHGDEHAPNETCGIAGCDHVDPRYGARCAGADGTIRLQTRAGSRAEHYRDRRVNLLDTARRDLQGLLRLRRRLAGRGFADGHVEHWLWRWPKVFANRTSYYKTAESPQDLADLRRLQGALAAKVPPGTPPQR